MSHTRPALRAPGGDGPRELLYNYYDETGSYHIIIRRAYYNKGGDGPRDLNYNKAGSYSKSYTL